LPKLFGTSGIRGNLDLISPELAMKLGLAVATSLNNHGDIAVAHDARTSSPYLRYAVSSGLMAGGCKAIQFGMIPTPVLGFGTRENKLNAGIMITGSHNPPTDNGLKCYNFEGREYTGEEEAILEEVILNSSYRPVAWNKVGSSIPRQEVLDDYVRAVLSDIKPVAKPLHVVVDCGNGVGSNVTPRLLSRLGCKVTAINANIDGAFPSRPPEPTPETLGDSSRLISEMEADLGIAHDSDADRLSVLDEEGRYVTNDRLLALFAKILLKQHGPGRIVTSVDTSPRIDEVAARYGGRVERTRLGKTHEALTTDQEKPILCCEPWKIIDVHWGYWGDAVYAACKLVAQLSDSEQSLSRLLEDIPDYPQSRLAFPCPHQVKDKAMHTIKAKLTAEKDATDVWTYDGIRVNYEDGSYALLRPSGTEPKIRVYCEAKSKKELKKLVEKCTALVQIAVRTE